MRYLVSDTAYALPESNDWTEILAETPKQAAEKYALLQCVDPDGSDNTNVLVVKGDDGSRDVFRAKTEWQPQVFLSEVK